MASQEASQDGYLRVGDLRRHLEGLSDDVLVVMSKDAEGNNYSPLAEAEAEWTYFPDTTWSGEIHEIHKDDIRFDDGVPCIVLWPVN